MEKKKIKLSQGNITNILNIFIAVKSHGWFHGNTPVLLSLINSMLPEVVASTEEFNCYNSTKHLFTHLVGIPFL